MTPANIVTQGIEDDFCGIKRRWIKGKKGKLNIHFIQLSYTFNILSFRLAYGLFVILCIMEQKMFLSFRVKLNLSIKIAGLYLHHLILQEYCPIFNNP